MSEALPRQEPPQAWRRRVSDTLRAAQATWDRTGRQPGSPEELRFLDATAAAVEAESCLGAFAPAAGETLPGFYRPLTCGHADADRRCLACGWSLCAACQPAAAGGACGRCAGPVYAVGEEQPVSDLRPFVEGY